MNTFVSESITPVYTEGTGQSIVPGDPVLPSKFAWRKQILEVNSVLSTWKEDGPCRSGKGEQYLRKHWYRIQIQEGREMEIYFERQARSKQQAKQRWWLYTITEPE